MATETATVDTDKLCAICGIEPQLGKAARHKMKKMCYGCAAKMKDEGTCPICRDVDVLKEVDDPAEHMLNCNGKLRSQPKPKSSGKSKKERDLEEERKVMEAQERLDARRANRDAPVKNILEMTLEELQARLNGKWIKVGRATTSTDEKITVKHVTELDGNDMTITDADLKIRVIDRKMIKKIQR